MLTTKQGEIDREKMELRTLLAFCEGVLQIVEDHRESFNMEGVREARRRIYTALRGRTDARDSETASVKPADSFISETRQ